MRASNEDKVIFAAGCLAVVLNLIFWGLIVWALILVIRHLS